jgi:hypothetical protein
MRDCRPGNIRTRPASASRARSPGSGRAAASAPAPSATHATNGPTSSAQPVPPARWPRVSRRFAGPEFITQAARERIAAVGAKAAFIEPGSPRENGCCGRFISKLRDERLNSANFRSLRRSAGGMECWRKRYNTVRPPHSSPGNNPPPPDVVLWPASPAAAESLAPPTRHPNPPPALRVAPDLSMRARHSSVSPAAGLSRRAGGGRAGLGPRVSRRRGQAGGASPEAP